MLARGPSNPERGLPKTAILPFFPHEVDGEADYLLSALLTSQLSSLACGTSLSCTLTSEPVGIQFQGSPVMIAVGSGLASEGYTVIADAAAGGDFWKTLMQRGGVPMGERVWERLRIQQGRLAGRTVAVILMCCCSCSRSAAVERASVRSLGRIPDIGQPGRLAFLSYDYRPAQAARTSAFEARTHLLRSSR
jgi:hypothetical protein